MLQVAGFFVQSIPDWIGWLKYLSFIYYGYNTLQKVSHPFFSHFTLLCAAYSCIFAPCLQCVMLQSSWLETLDLAST